MDEWVFKYSPKTLDDLIIGDDIKRMAANYMKRGSFPNSILVGRPGIGKTSLAKIVVDSIPDCVHMFINASKEVNIDMVRNRLHEFVSASGINDGLKFVILDEIDGLTSQNAQNAMKSMIEECLDDTRFILTGNKTTGLLEALESRCTSISIPPAPVANIFERLKWILDNEDISYTKDDLKIILTKIVKEKYPKIRDMIKHLEMCCIGGSFELVNYQDGEKLDMIAQEILERSSDWFSCRDYWIKNEMTFSRDYIALAGRIFNMIRQPKVIALIADHIYRMNQVLDQEIEFSAMMLKVGEALKK